MRRSRVLALAAAAALAAGGGAFALAHRGPAAVAVREAAVTRGLFAVVLPETGTVALPRVVTVPAGVPGTLVRLAVRPGDRVAAGQTVALLANDQLEANVHQAEDALLSAEGRVSSVAQTSAVLPEQNRSAVVQAQAAVVAATAQLGQARQDAIAGTQSGLGYGGQTAQEQQLTADTALARANTELGEAKRAYDADTYLLAQRGISRDAVLQARARYDEASVAQRQASEERRILGDSLGRSRQVLRDRVRSASDGLRQAQAALAAANVAAAQSHAGDGASADADRERARGDLAYARAQLDRLTVRAPIAGTVIAVANAGGDGLQPAEPGTAVVAGEMLARVSADARFVVRARVDEQDAAALRVGERATVGGEDLGGATLGGRVAAISPVAQRSEDVANTSRQVATTIALDRGSQALRDGMTVDVDIRTLEVPDAVLVPLDAVRRDAAGRYAFAVRGGRVARAALELGPANDTVAVVRAGLERGDRVVTDRDATLAPGDAVTPDDAASAAPAASP